MEQLKHSFVSKIFFLSEFSTQIIRYFGLKTKKGFFQNQDEKNERSSQVQEEKNIS